MTCPFCDLEPGRSADGKVACAVGLDETCEQRAAAPSPAGGGVEARNAELVKLGNGLADDLAEGHWSMADAVTMIRALTAALSHPVSGGGEGQGSLAPLVPTEGHEAAVLVRRVLAATKQPAGTLSEALWVLAEIQEICHQPTAPAVAPSGPEYDLLIERHARVARLFRQQAASERAYRSDQKKASDLEADADAIDVMNTAMRDLMVEKKELAAMVESARSMMRIVSDGAEDEGDRVYFGSSNHADWLRSEAEKIEACLAPSGGA